jgi:tetratricopeptide (TPR) repeat protein
MAALIASLGLALAAHAGAAFAASDEPLATLRATAAEQLQRKDYASAITAAQRYVRAGGAEADVRPVLAQAYFHKGDYENAAREFQWQVQAAERAGRAPGEDLLLMLQKCYAQLNDANATAWGLEKLVTYYPTPAYWADLLDRTQKRPDFGAPLALDVNRLRLLTGALPGAAGYLQLATQAADAGFPAEAARVMDRGFEKGVLGSGPDAARQRQWREQLRQQASAQRQRIVQPDVLAAAERASDGIELVNLGFANVTQGRHDVGLAQMEQGIRKGGGLANRPQYARLHLAIAYLMAGQTTRAIEALKGVGGRHGAADLARIWGLYAAHLS